LTPPPTCRSNRRGHALTATRTDSFPFPPLPLTNPPPTTHLTPPHFTLHPTRRRGALQATDDDIEIADGADDLRREPRLPATLCRQLLETCGHNPSGAACRTQARTHLPTKTIFQKRACSLEAAPLALCMHSMWMAALVIILAICNVNLLPACGLGTTICLPTLPVRSYLRVYGHVVERRWDVIHIGVAYNG
jgi:hypothetical protein